MRAVFHGVPAVAIALATVATLRAQGIPEAEPTARETSHWVEAIEQGGTVRVVNAFGDVYARFGGYASEVEVLATSQRLDSSRPELVVSLIPEGPKGLGVIVRFASDEPVGRPAWGATKDRVDLVVFIPQGAVLDVETRDGGIEVKGVQSDVSLSSLKGDLRILSVKGRVRAKSSRGRIAATLESSVTTEPQDLVTETGDIEVYLWEDAHADVRVATSGEISTDFSLEIEHRRFEEPGKHGRATVGKGGPPLTLESKRGRIRLLRLPRDFKPDR